MTNPDNQTDTMSKPAEWQPIETAPKDGGEGEPSACFLVAEHLFAGLWSYDVARSVEGRLVHAWTHKPYKKHEAGWTHWRPLDPPTTPTTDPRDDITHPDHDVVCGHCGEMPENCEAAPYMSAKIIGIGRDATEPQCLNLYFDRKPLDAEMKYIFSMITKG